MNYTEKDLVQWGNYLLSKERKKKIVHKDNLDKVTDADLANWKDKNKKRNLDK